MIALFEFIWQNQEILASLLIGAITTWRATSWGRKYAEACDLMVTGIEEVSEEAGSATDVKAFVKKNIRRGKLATQNVVKDSVSRIDIEKESVGLFKGFLRNFLAGR